MMPVVMRQLSALLAAGTLLAGAAACSSSDDSSSESSTTTATTVGGGGGGDVVGALDGYDSEAICASLTVVSDIVLEASNLGGDPTALKDYVIESAQPMIDALRGAAEISPPDIADALVRVADSAGERASQLAEAETDAEVQELFLAPNAAVDEVGPLLNEVAEEECGFVLGL